MLKIWKKNYKERLCVIALFLNFGECNFANVISQKLFQLETWDLYQLKEYNEENICGEKFEKKIYKSVFE